MMSGRTSLISPRSQGPASGQRRARAARLAGATRSSPAGGCGPGCQLATTTRYPAPAREAAHRLVCSELAGASSRTVRPRSSATAVAEHEARLVHRRPQSVSRVPQVGAPGHGGTAERIVREQPRGHLKQRDVQAVIGEASGSGEPLVIAGPVAEVVAAELGREAKPGGGRVTAAARS